MITKFKKFTESRLKSSTIYKYSKAQPGQSKAVIPGVSGRDQEILRGSCGERPASHNLLAKTRMLQVQAQGLRVDCFPVWGKHGQKWSLLGKNKGSYFPCEGRNLRAQGTSKRTHTVRSLLLVSGADASHSHGTSRFREDQSTVGALRSTQGRLGCASIHRSACCCLCFLLSSTFILLQPLPCIGTQPLCPLM